MNKYINIMKNALTDYYNKAKATEQKKDEARNTYQQDIAAEQIARLDAALEAEKQAAIFAITEAKDEGIAEAYRWGTLDGKKIDDDVKLLKFDLSSEQFAALVKKHLDNATMCFILKQYAEKHERPETTPGERGSVGFATPLVIPTVEAKIEAYKKLSESAIATIESIGGYGWGRGSDSVFVESSVSSFGTPSLVNYQYYEALGE